VDERVVGRKTRRATRFDLLYRLSAPVLSRSLGVAALEIPTNPDAPIIDARRGQKTSAPAAQNRRDLAERG
jgi:hypothetical protein